MCLRSGNPMLFPTISHIIAPGCSQEPGTEHLKELAKIYRTGRCPISISRWEIYYNRLVARNSPLRRKNLEEKSLQRFPSEDRGNPSGVEEITAQADTSSHSGGLFSENQLPARKPEVVLQLRSLELLPALSCSLSSRAGSSN